MNIFLREMRAHRKSLILWCIGVFFMVSAGMSKYAGLSGSGESMNDVMKQIPKELRSILGFGEFDLSKASGYYGVLYLYLILMTTIHAAMLGAGIIAKEERDKTAEFLFAKPTSRYRVVTAKLAAALLNVILVNIATLASSIAFVGYFGKGENVNRDITVTMIGMFILQLLFLSIGTVLAAFSKNPKTAASTATGILLSTFILSVAIDLSENLENLKFLTPFKYYEAKKLMYGGSFDAVYVTLSAVLIVGLTFLTYMSFNKRDLHI